MILKILACAMQWCGNSFMNIHDSLFPDWSDNFFCMVIHSWIFTIHYFLIWSDSSVVIHSWIFTIHYFPDWSDSSVVIHSWIFIIIHFLIDQIQNIHVRTCTTVINGYFQFNCLSHVGKPLLFICVCACVCVCVCVWVCICRKTRTLFRHPIFRSWMHHQTWTSADWGDTCSANGC